jgi:ankyrin repeat protein
MLVVGMLKELGCDVDTRDTNGITRLARAVGLASRRPEGDCPLVHALLAAGADANAGMPNGRTALHSCASMRGGAA